MDTRKEKVTTTNIFLQFQLVYICYSHLFILKQTRNIVSDLHKDNFSANTISNIEIFLKSPLSITLSLIMLYEDVKKTRYRVLPSLNCAPYFTHLVLY